MVIHARNGSIAHLPAPPNGSNVLLSRTLRRSTIHTSNNTTATRLDSHSRFRGGRKKTKRVTAFHRVRDIDSPAPLSGGRYKYAIREKTPSKTVDTKGLGRAGFSEDSF